MTAKDYLSQIQRIEGHIKRIEDQLRTIHAEMSMLKSPVLDADRVHGSGNDDKLLELIIKYGDVEKRLWSEMDKLVTTRERVRGEIESMANDKYRRVLYDRYVKHMSWDEIASDMMYSRRWVEMLHGHALHEFARMKNNS